MTDLLHYCDLCARNAYHVRANILPQVLRLWQTVVIILSVGSWGHRGHETSQLSTCVPTNGIQNMCHACIPLRQTYPSLRWREYGIHLHVPTNWAADPVSGDTSWEARPEDGAPPSQAVSRVRDRTNSKLIYLRKQSINSR